ncbi:myosin head, putative [Ichthyophthirius multifiliis]|uniref:Myosin head, putative n=1 Tax=Ichthyophthirius multifiliis TaxID=5932 RepID=G0QKX7_ICHMU|nr:myosin head, putative [Ichthyophthirius multifiliis]EGR34128.1 myosin head, putative [Ichthyophthirius multifiliis]|eukprot:XP_004039432.1 myosin head, putative [Ichthyophthirius multifiliis]
MIILVKYKIKIYSNKYANYQKQIKKALQNGLTNKLRIINKQEYLSPLNLQECINIKDTLSKYLYEKLFNWIVQKLNENITPTNQQNDKSLEGEIGLLDIYGFEVFKENGFEQFFINYTNEKLQQLYIQYVFKQEEQIFINEGLKEFIQYLNFTDNKPIINLLDQPPNGIFNILDDICQTKGNNEKFLNKIRQANKNNKHFITPKMASKHTFTIVHSSKGVEYTVNNFTEKKQDSLQNLVVNTLAHSTDALFKIIFQITQDDFQQQQQKGKSLGSKFRNEIQILINQLMVCECHFIRCIKPNDEKKKDLFKTTYLLDQVRSLGVLESIKIGKQSFPIRKSYQQFYRRYAFAAKDFRSWQQMQEQNVDFYALSKELFQNIFKGTNQSGDILLGKGKIFMQNKGLLELEKIYEEKLINLNKIARKFQQAFIGFYLFIKLFYRLKTKNRHKQLKD